MSSSQYTSSFSCSSRELHKYFLVKAVDVMCTTNSGMWDRTAVIPNLVPALVRCPREKVLGEGHDISSFLCSPCCVRFQLGKVAVACARARACLFVTFTLRRQYLGQGKVQVGYRGEVSQAALHGYGSDSVALVEAVSTSAGLGSDAILRHRRHCEVVQGRRKHFPRT